MKSLFVFFVSFILVIFYTVFATVLFAQVTNIPTLPASKQPSAVSSPSEKSSTNPYSILMPNLAAPISPPKTPAKIPTQTPTNTPPQTPTKSRRIGSNNIESISPYDSGRNIILLPNSVDDEKFNSRKTRQQIIEEKARKAIETKNIENEALSRAASIIKEYDPERINYKADLERLLEIDIETSTQNKFTSQSTGQINSVAPNPDIKNPNAIDDPLQIRDLVSAPNNLPSTSDPFLAKWEYELAALMRSDKVDDNKSEAIAALTLQIERRKQFLARQAESLAGADVFEIDSALQLSRRDLEDGWCNLFDGKTFFGWRVQKDGFYGGGRFTIEDGEICSDPQHPGMLYTTNQFGDSTISFEYCVDDDTELFFLYRTSPNPHDLHSSCYTIVLNSSERMRPRGTILGRVKLDREQIRSITAYDRNDSNDSEKDQKAVWRRARVSCDGGMITCTIDRQIPTTLMDISPIGRGYIGLLVTRGKARFRNIIWRPGMSYPLFDGIEIDDSWRYRRGTMAVTAANLTMQLRGGPGVIESIETFSDFVLQFEYRITNVSGKAGLFFRSNPREEKSGYEISLQNFPTRKERDDFFAIDAGSFVGRKSGRYVGTEDMKWNHFTLSAIDRQFQTWVNGVPVCEMTDKSKLPKTITVVKARDTVDGKDVLDYMLPNKDEFHKNGTIQFYLPTDMSNIDLRNVKISKIEQRKQHKKTFEDHKKSTWKEKLKEEKRIENEIKLDDQMRENK
jgi:hypothetical protein